jgi:O-antigen ligase/tetratricopeptide (TPR) repeat protein
LKTTRKPARVDRPKSGDASVVETVLLLLCLCVLALRATYTEAPTVQTVLMAESLADTIYSLTLSGFLIFVFIFWLCWRVYTNRLRYRVSGIEIGLVVFLVAAVLSAVGASDKRSAITYTAMLVGPIFAALLLVQILSRGRHTRLVLIVVAALGVVATFQCAEQFLVSNAITIEQYEKDPVALLEPLGIEPGSFQQFLFEHRLYSRGIRGFFTTSNSAASFGILAALSTVALLVSRWQGHRTKDGDHRYAWLNALALLIIVAGFLMTRSKGGFVGFVVAALLLAALWTIDRWAVAWRRRALTLIVTVGIVVMAAGGHATVRYGMDHGRLPGGNSMLVRWQYWTASMQMYADHATFGVGPGNFSYYYPHYKPPAALESVSDPHCLPLSILVQFGPAGLVGFLAMLLAPLGRACVAAMRRRLPADREERSPYLGGRPLAMLGVICGVLLLIRPMLLPRSGQTGMDVLLYELMTLYVAPVAAFLIGFLLLAMPLASKSNRASDVVWFAPLGCAVAGVLIHNLIDFALFEPGVWTTFWLILACVAATDGPPDTAPSEAQAAKPSVKASVVSVGVVLFAAYAMLVWQPVYVTTSNIHRAQSAAGAGRFDRAHDLLAAASQADPLSPTAAYLDGRMYVHEYDRTGRRQPELLEAAARRFQEAVDVNPADYKHYEKLGDVYSDLRRWEHAYDWYLQAANLYAGSGRLWFKAARAADMLGQPEKALPHYRQSVDVEDSYRTQFRQMYPERETVVSRLGQQRYRLAQRRIEEIANQPAAESVR